MVLHGADFDQRNGKTCFKFFAFIEEVRTKLVYSSCLWLSYFMSGWIIRQWGPALLDIQQMTGVSFTVASSYLIAFNIGYIFGCCFSGYFQDRVHSSVLLCLTSAGSAVFVAWLPWSTQAIETFAVIFFIGICIGKIDSIVIAELSALWGARVSVPVQIAYFCFSVGGSIAVYSTAPFLSTTIENHVPNNNNYTISKSGNGMQRNQHHFHSRLYIPFSFAALLAAVCAAIYLVIFCKKRKGYVIDYVDIKVRSNGKVMNVTQKILAVVLFFIIMSVSAAINFDISFFLPSFLTKLSVSSRSESATIASFFTIFQSVGRFTGFGTVQIVDHYSLLIGHSAICFLGLIGIWNCVVYNTSVLLLCCSVAIAGFGFSITEASLKAWVEKSFFPVTGLVSSFFFASKMIGNIISAAAIGYCVEKYSPFLFLYITLGEVLFFIALIFIANGFRITVFTK